MRLIGTVILLLGSGFLSTYLYCIYFEKGGVFFPGLLYTSTTVVIFLLTKCKVGIKNLCMYYILMMLTYLVVWFLTFWSTWYAILCGILTAAIGALVSFGLASKFVVKIKFNKLHVILIGGLSFFLTDIVHLSFTYFFDSSVLENVLHTEKDSLTLYAEVFVFWQVLVGTKLFLSVSNTKLDDSEFFKK